MRLSQVRIYNYRAFKDSGVFTLHPRLNIIVGANNSGKTALLEVLTLRIKNERYLPCHLNYYECPERSYADVKLAMSGDEIKRTAVKTRRVDVLDAERYGAGKFPEDPKPSTMDLLQRVKDCDGLTVTLTLEKNVLVCGPLFPPHVLYGAVQNNTPDHEQFRKFEVDHSLEVFSDSSSSAPPSTDFSVQYANALRDYIYLFDADRYALFCCAWGDTNPLSRKAENLAVHLNKLRNNTPRWDRFTSYVRRIFPDVREIVLDQVTEDPSQVGIFVLRTCDDGVDKNRRRLDQCGNGLSQVLAMLYLAVATTEECVVLIDEPQSFLHPAATRELMSILTSYDHIQFIVSTHWPDLLSFPGDHSIIQLESTPDGSRAKTFSPKDVQQLRGAAAALGGGLNCLIGASAVLWVEGPTEEQCFAALLANDLAGNRLGFYIVPHGSTGTFLSRQRKELIDVYKGIREAGLLVPSKSGFLFDSEELTEREREEIADLVDAPIRFLSRPMIESYMLCPSAIAEVINEDLADADDFEPTTAEAVEESLNRAIENADTAYENRPDQRNAAKALELVFGEICGPLQHYRKTTHGSLLCRKCMSNNWGPIAELKDELDSAIAAVLELANA